MDTTIQPIEGEDIQRVISESVKLIKNSKGYNWEVRIMPSDRIENMLKEADLIRLAKLNDWLVEKYGKED